MDISADEAVATDTLGRRSGPRRQYTVEEKRRIVEETHIKGASVSNVARRYEVNPNQVFAWRQLYRKRAAVAHGTSSRAGVKMRLHNEDTATVYGRRKWTGCR